MRALAVTLALGLTAAAAAQETTDLAAEHSLTEPGLYAVFQTSHGTFVAELFPEESPVTVQNFVDLATGAKPWRAIDRSSPGGDQSEHTGDPFYDGTIFHRVIPGFMIQGGAPRGVANPGASGPGFTIPDEFSPDLRHDVPGRLSMANAGPGTGGSQFFVTVAPTPWLDGRHTIFGQVIQGQNVIDAITTVDRDPQDRPLQDVVLERLSIVTVGQEAGEPAAAASPETSN